MKNEIICVNQGCRLSVSTDARLGGELNENLKNESFFYVIVSFDDELKKISL